LNGIDVVRLSEQAMRGIAIAALREICRGCSI
jgi:hypothetical protein